MTIMFFSAERRGSLSFEKDVCDFFMIFYWFLLKLQ